MESTGDFMINYYQPVLGLCFGIVLLALIAYMNWYSTNKADITTWIATRLLRGSVSKGLAEKLFMYLTVILLFVGGTMIIVAIAFLER